MKQPIAGDGDYTDGRRRWNWESCYPKEARNETLWEAWILLAMLAASLLFAGFFLGLAGQPFSTDIGIGRLEISFRLVAIFFTGCVGGVTFSMKWLIHAVATGKWHLDRRFWRLMVPIMGGVYACVVMTLFSSGTFLIHTVQDTSSMAGTAALAFMVGYFSDGVSGLLSNIANAVFGTLEKK
ncbi:MAG: hypothetical protein AB7O39_09790 [Flavobacteriaceae bacterium]